jgi:Ran GTPase-activating protein (RanGAP) involved in mRNA processing and transport
MKFYGSMQTIIRLSYLNIFGSLIMDRSSLSAYVHVANGTPSSPPESGMKQQSHVPKDGEKAPTIRSGNLPEIFEKNTQPESGNIASPTSDVQPGSSFSASNRAHEMGQLISTAPTFHTASSTCGMTTTASTAVNNPEWTQFHQQALDNDGYFKMTEGMDIGAVCHWLASSPAGVQSAEFNEVAMRDVDLVTMGKAITSNTSLKELVLKKNRIGPDGVRALVEGLNGNTCLAKLKLENNVIGDEGSKVLAEFLKCNTSLTTLNLKANHIGCVGAEALAEGLKVNKWLTVLVLSDNGISDKGAKALAECLKANSRLTLLYLDSNCIYNDGAKALAEGLHGNTHLSMLTLDANFIGDAGVKALAKGLTNNTSLNVLILSSNSISPEAAGELAEALKSNASLIVLDLRDEFRDWPVKQLIRARLTETFQAREAKAGAETAFEVINAALGLVNNPGFLMYPREIMNHIVDHMMQVGLKREVIRLAAEMGMAVDLSNS